LRAAGPPGANLDSCHAGVKLEPNREGRAVAELLVAEVLDDDWSSLGPLDDNMDAVVENRLATEVPEYDYGGPASGGGASYGGLPGEPILAPAPGGHETTEEQIKDQLRAIRIEIADFATTQVLRSDADCDYLKAQLGMNIIVPRGQIRQLRFRVRLAGAGGVVYAIDGFPKDAIDHRTIVGGKITVGVTKAFQLLATTVGAAVGGPAGAAAGTAAGKVAGDLLDVELNPFEFAIGDVRNIKIDFSEANTSDVEWWFKGGEGGILNSLGVMLTLRKPHGVKTVTGAVSALWQYDAGWWKKKFKSQEKTVRVFPQPI
jgi:hypothetical protein